MNKTCAALALAAVCGFSTGTAQAKDLTGWFVNGGVGTAHYNATLDGYGSGHESDTAYKFNVGWRSQFIGVEAGYIDLGSVSANDGSGDSGKLSGDGWTLGLNGHFNLTRMWYVSARGGAFLWKLHAKGSLANGAGGVQRYAGDAQSTDGYAGVGTGLDFNRHWSAGVNFDYYTISKNPYNIDSKIWTVSAEYRF